MRPRVLGLHEASNEHHAFDANRPVHGRLLEHRITNRDAQRLDLALRANAWSGSYLWLEGHSAFKDNRKVTAQTPVADLTRAHNPPMTAQDDASRSLDVHGNSENQHHDDSAQQFHAQNEKRKRAEHEAQAHRVKERRRMNLEAEGALKKQMPEICKKQRQHLKTSSLK
ncbi:hypothetical protein PsorP6_016068 [Peronosclerospora sorghi]|uniref:Uncharacterized protein n=1 Tax=Peronosclerospora sorghi TaxID=230839 RepID=A0ACC0WP10_9STRA|nr:hypothetical protein PsorP6_016068 [Peronosclerospora sorghi]